MTAKKATSRFEDFTAGVLGLLWFALCVSTLFVGMIFVRSLPLVLLSEAVVFALIAIVSAYTERHNLKVKQGQAQLQQFVADSASAPAAPTLPSYRQLLERNLIVGVIFLPIFVLIGALTLGGLFYVMESAREGETSRQMLRLLLTMFLPIALYGTLFILNRVGKLVDRQLGLGQPSTDEDQAAREVQKALNQARLPYFGVFVVGSVLVFLMFIRIIPEGIGFVLLAGLSISFFGWNLWHIRRGPTHMIRDAIKTEHGDDSALMREFEQQVQLQKQSTMGQMNRLMGFWVIAFMILLLVVVVGAALVLVSLNLNKDQYQAGMVGVLCLMVGVMFGGINLISRFVKSPIEQEGKQIEAALNRADYETALRLTDATIARVPNFETRLPGALAYLNAGKIDEAELMIRTALVEITQMVSREHGSSFHPLLAKGLTVLGAIQLSANRLQDAEETLLKALELEPKDPFTIGNYAEAMLAQGKTPDLALKQIKTAQKLQSAQHQPPKVVHLVFEAWAQAQLGNPLQADDLMTQAIEMAKSREHIPLLAETYYYGGFVARAQGKHTASAASFNKALNTDPHGLIGKLAKKQLGIV
jgi:hypothetical protein